VQLRLYLDTSVLGALTDREPVEWVAATRLFMEDLCNGRWLAVLSTLVLEEIAEAPEHIRATLTETVNSASFEVVEFTPEADALANAYMAEGLFPAKYIDDARHIAVATICRVDAVVSWNFKHMVNLETRRKVHGVNMLQGFSAIDIVSPLELGHE
jgi:predicted nucleic acid-binding protein